MSIAFGPVPSRRLGRSLGINNIPPKTCTYSCVYCQVGRTRQMQAERRAFFATDELIRAVESQHLAATRAGEAVDYLTFVSDGEPTLDIHLGTEIDRLRPLETKIAVITNASLLWRRDVRNEMARVDWVSLKVDAVSERTWRRVDRPHRALELATVLDGMRTFAATYAGELATETMLVKGINDGDDDLVGLAYLLADLKPSTAYLSVPTRPPAETWVRAPDEQALHLAYQILNERLTHLEYLIGYEGNAFAASGNAAEDLLSITAVHPMREEAVAGLLARTGENWELVQRLMPRTSWSRRPTRATPTMCADSRPRRRPPRRRAHR